MFLVCDRKTCRVVEKNSNLISFEVAKIYFNSTLLELSSFRFKFGKLRIKFTWWEIYGPLSLTHDFPLPNYLNSPIMFN
jgi:hypothetical protein